MSEVIRLSGISMDRDDRRVLTDVNFSVDRGDFVAITGPNGGGKTTLLRIILRLLKPTAGTVDYFDAEGNPVGRLPIGYLPQKSMIDSRFPITVSEVIASGLLGAKGMAKAERRDRVDEIIELTALRSHADVPIGRLSGGQLQRTLLGRALVAKPEILVLDEPLSYVDKRMEHRIYEIVGNLAGSTTILLVSHEMSTIAGMATRHIIVDRTVTPCHHCNDLKQ